MRGKVQTHINRHFRVNKCRNWQDTTFEKIIAEHFLELNKDLNSMIGNIFWVPFIANKDKPAPRHTV